jgi:hypothetical protein
MTREIDEIISELAIAHPAWKQYEERKDKLRKEFFEAVTEEETQRELAEKVVEVEAADEGKARLLFEKRYPAWDVGTIRPHPDKDGIFEAIIKENPEFTPYTYTHSGKVFQRQVRAGGVYVDDDMLKADDPDLWEEVTEEVRVLRPLEGLPAHTLARLQAYIFEGKPKLTFPSPKEEK